MLFTVPVAASPNGVAVLARWQPGLCGQLPNDSAVHFQSERCPALHRFAGHSGQLPPGGSVKTVLPLESTMNITAARKVVLITPQLRQYHLYLHSDCPVLLSGREWRMVISGMGDAGKQRNIYLAAASAGMFTVANHGVTRGERSERNWSSRRGDQYSDSDGLQHAVAWASREVCWEACDSVRLSRLRLTARKYWSRSATREALPSSAPRMTHLSWTWRPR